MSQQLDRYDRRALAVIAEHGWMVQGVFPTETDPGVPFSYTVGLTLAGLPELVIAGLPHETAAQLLNTAAKLSLAAELTAGQTLNKIASVPLRVVDAPLAEVNMARHLYGGQKVCSLQLLWPAKNGTFPGEPGWPKDARQPVYGDLAIQK